MPLRSATQCASVDARPAMFSTRGAAGSPAARPRFRPGVARANRGATAPDHRCPGRGAQRQDSDVCANPPRVTGTPRPRRAKVRTVGPKQPQPRKNPAAARRQPPDARVERPLRMRVGDEVYGSRRGENRQATRP
jgi:hypothetical protein